jgi:hypothetical protein
MVARRKPVIMRLKLASYHTLPKSSSTTQLVQVQIAHLLGPKMAEFALMNEGMLTEQVAGNGILEKRVSNGLQSFQVDSIVTITHGESLQYE